MVIQKTPQRQIPTPEEIIREFKPDDYIRQSLALAKIVDKLMEEKRIIALSTSLLHTKDLEPKERVKNLLSLYNLLYDLPDYKKGTTH